MSGLKTSFSSALAGFEGPLRSELKKGKGRLKKGKRREKTTPPRIKFLVAVLLPTIECWYLATLNSAIVFRIFYTSCFLFYFLLFTFYSEVLWYAKPSNRQHKTDIAEGLKYNFQGWGTDQLSRPHSSFSPPPPFISWAHVSTAGSQIINDRLNVLSIISCCFSVWL